MKKAAAEAATTVITMTIQQSRQAPNETEVQLITQCVQGDLQAESDEGEVRRNRRSRELFRPIGVWIAGSSSKRAATYVTEKNVKYFSLFNIVHK